MLCNSYFIMGFRLITCGKYDLYINFSALYPNAMSPLKILHLDEFEYIDILSEVLCILGVCVVF
jgi:hypothetical protein